MSETPDPSAPPPPSAAPEGDPPAPDGAANGDADGSGAELRPRRRGRPPGTVDKRPRKRRSDAAPSGGAPRSHKAKKPSPFAASVEGEGASSAPPPGKAGAPPASLQEFVTMPADRIAAMGVSLLNVIVVSAVARSAGGAAGIAMALSPTEATEIEKPATVVIEKYLPRMSPEWALVLTILLLYGNKYTGMKLAQAGLTMEEAMRMAQEQDAVLKAAAERAQGAGGAQA